jgi:hypothetical protein
MSTIDQNADLHVLAAQIKALGPQIEMDAERAARDNDVAGLVFIANMARGLPGASSMRLGLALDLADYLRGMMPKMSRGRVEVVK